MVLSLYTYNWNHLNPLPLACATSSILLVAHELNIIQVPIDVAAMYACMIKEQYMSYMLLVWRKYIYTQCLIL